jgi:hypothetical protein
MTTDPVSGLRMHREQERSWFWVRAFGRRDGNGSPPSSLQTRASNLYGWSELGLGLIILVAASLFVSPARTVNRVQLTRKETFLELPRLFGSPSYYLQFLTLSGPRQLEKKPGVPIGNGLVWLLERPEPLAQVYEVQVFEAGMFSDRLVDRVRVSGRRATGQRFQFHLQGRFDWLRPLQLLGFGAGLVMVLMHHWTFRSFRPIHERATSYASTGAHGSTHRTPSAESGTKYDPCDTRS